MTRCCQVVFQAVGPWGSCLRSHAMDSPVVPQQYLIALYSSGPSPTIGSNCAQWCGV